MTVRVFWPAAWLAVVLVGCAPRGVVKPHAPDMTGLVESYESPTGVLDPDDTEALAATVALVNEGLARTELATRLRELLTELIKPVVPSDSDDDDGDSNGFQLNVKANGYLKAVRICPGWTLPSEVDPENGSIHATATFSEKGLDPVVWGTVVACRYRVGSTRVELSPAGANDGLRVYWGEGIDRETIETRDLVFSINLRVDIDGDSLPLEVDFRVVDGGSFEYLVPVDSGTLVVRADDDGTFVLRSREGTFSCDESFDCDLESRND
jgi:hypothetical protein